jgi:hypothetical protein
MFACSMYSHVRRSEKNTRVGNLVNVSDRYYEIELGLIIFRLF